MKIWLDDERNPADPYWQREINSESDYTWIKDPQQAIDLLRAGIVTHISFDHDLGTKLTGYDVAKVIEELAYLGKIPPLVWRIHTANAVGRLNIFRALQRADEYWCMVQ